MNELQKQELIKLMAPVLKGAKASLYDLEYIDTKQNKTLRVLIEHADGSMDLDTCVQVSEKLSLLFDEVTFLKDEYVLEVSSPGAERPLKNKEQFVRALKKYVYVKTKEPVLNYTEFYGDLEEVGEKSIRLSCKDKTRIRKVEIEWANIETAMTAVKF